MTASPPLRLIDQINLNQLRVFQFVYEQASITEAAKALHLTQPGVSQHIRSLEDSLGIPLFDRIGRKVVPTAGAHELFRHTRTGLNTIESALEAIRPGAKLLAGTVRIGIPNEFGNNVILPVLSGLCRKHPLLRFDLRLGLAPELTPLLEADTLDFALVDDFRMGPFIITEKIYDEVLELCAKESWLKRFGPVKATASYFESLEYVDFEENEPVLRMWFKHHFGTARLDLNVRTTVMDVQSVARLILSGVGAGVLPGHLSTKLVQEGTKLYRFKGRSAPLKNSISLASLRGRSHSHATLEAMSAIRTAIRDPRVSKN